MFGKAQSLRPRKRVRIDVGKYVERAQLIEKLLPPIGVDAAVVLLMLIRSPRQVPSGSVECTVPVTDKL